MLKILLSAAVLASTLSLSACHTMPLTSSVQNLNLQQLQNRTWVVTQIGTIELQPNAKQPNLHLDALTQRVSGSDGCNRIGGRYMATGEQLAFSQLASTKMMCLDANMLLASKFSEALSQVAHYQVYHKTLKLLDRHGNVLIQLSNMPAR